MTTIPQTESALYAKTLSNGLLALGHFMPSVESVGACFWVRTGARDELDQQMGISHFLEHMAFKRTKTRTYEQINREFEEMGAESNAFTSLEMTVFWARVLSENLSWAMDLLSELVQPMLDAADFDQERNVILEEIALYQDRPQYVVFEDFLQAFFDDAPLSHPTLGTPDTIKGLAVDDMRSYWQHRYGANNIIFSVAGKFDWEQVLVQLETFTSSWHTGTADRRLSAPTYRGRVRVQTNERWKQEQIILGTPSIARDDPRYYAAAVLATVLGDDTGSRLFWAVNQKGLAEQVGASIDAFDDAGVLMINASTPPDKAAETLRTIRDELERLQNGEIGEDELERAKTKLMASVVIGGESSRERMLGLIQSWLAHGRLESLDDIRESIAAVALTDVREVLDAFPVTENQVVAAVGPLTQAELGLTA